MTSDAENTEPATVAEVASEIEAAIIKSVLEAEGVRCWIIGGLLTGFRAELPGRAQVVVRATDADLAREILATVALEAEAAAAFEDDPDTDPGPEE